MTTSFKPSYSQELPLTGTPLITGEREPIYNEMLRVHNAIRLILDRFDTLMGTNNLSVQESATRVGDNNVDNFNRISILYRRFRQSAVKGDIVGFHSDQSVSLIGSENTPDFQHISVGGLCNSDSVTAGQVGEVLLVGLIYLPLYTLVPGGIYNVRRNAPYHKLQLEDFVTYANPSFVCLLAITDKIGYFYNRSSDETYKSI